MNSLDFLYIALGGGFVLLVVFLCVMILNLTLVLRDVSKLMTNVREISDKIHDAVLEPMKTLSEMTAGFGFLHQMIEKLRARFEAAESEGECEDGEGNCSEEERQHKHEKKETNKAKKGFFSVKKLSK